MKTPKLTWEGDADADGNWLQRMTPREVIAGQAAEIESLLTVEAISWRALTDLLIGAQQQSQSHADVIALVAGALHEASALLPSNDRRAGLATEGEA